MSDGDNATILRELNEAVAKREPVDLSASERKDRVSIKRLLLSNEEEQAAA